MLLFNDKNFMKHRLQEAAHEIMMYTKEKIPLVKEEEMIDKMVEVISKYNKSMTELSQETKEVIAYLQGKYSDKFKKAKKGPEKDKRVDYGGIKGRYGARRGTLIGEIDELLWKGVSVDECLEELKRLFPARSFSSRYVKQILYERKSKLRKRGIDITSEAGYFKAHTPSLLDVKKKEDKDEG